MPEDIKYLSARRAYEFGPDELRLSVLSTPPVQQQIRQLFQFQAAVVGRPQETFGPVPATLPPGLVFNVGAWVAPDGVVVPIRLLHVEQRRIVFDVAGPSQVLGPIFSALTAALSVVPTPDGTPAIGALQRVRDYSELTAKLRFPLSKLLAPRVRDLLGHVLGVDNTMTDKVMTPVISAQVQTRSEEYPGLDLPNADSLQLDLRAGNKPDEQVYYSMAPLDSDAHVKYLTELESLLSTIRLGLAHGSQSRRACERAGD